VNCRDGPFCRLVLSQLRFQLCDALLHGVKLFRDSRRYLLIGDVSMLIVGFALRLLGWALSKSAHRTYGKTKTTEKYSQPRVKFNISMCSFICILCILKRTILFAEGSFSLALNARSNPDDYSA
jgi:hypothetical protein